MACLLWPGSCSTSTLANVEETAHLHQVCQPEESKLTETFQKLREIVSDILQIPQEQVTLTCSPENVSSWDSVQHLILILAIEAEFGIHFDPAEMDRTNSISQILELLEPKLMTKVQG